MAGFARRRRIEMEGDGDVGERRDGIVERVGNEFRAGGTVTSALPANFSARSLAASMAGDAGESGRATCTDEKCSASVPKVLETCTRSGRSAQRNMKDLPHRGIAKVVWRQCILRLGDLLRCAPSGYPRLYARRVRSRSLRADQGRSKHKNRNGA